MGDKRFGPLQRRLLQSGVAPRHVRRLLVELDDHFDDLRQAAIEEGCDPFAAHDRALQGIGDQQQLAKQITGMSELRTWVYRFPRVARIYYPFAYVLLLPAAPVFAGLAHASILVRWGAALFLSASVTGAMLLIMQLSIALG